MSERLFFLSPNEQFVSYIMVKTSYIQWDDYVCFVLDQHIWLAFYTASSVKLQSACRPFAPLRHIILIQSQPVFALTP